LREILTAEEVGWDSQKLGPLRAYEQEPKLRLPEYEQHKLEFEAKQKSKNCDCK
jgi:hypothetical protein